MRHDRSKSVHTINNYGYWLIFFLFFCQESSETDEDDEEVVEINVMSAIVFVITASTFLLLLYYFMSSWFVWLLIVLFCIGGIQVLLVIMVLSLEILLIMALKKMFGCVHMWSVFGHGISYFNNLHLESVFSRRTRFQVISEP